MGQVFRSEVVEKGVRSVCDYITDFPTFIAPYQIEAAGISASDIISGVFGNELEKEMLALWKIWSDASDYDVTNIGNWKGTAVKAGDRGSWRIQIKELYGVPRFYSIRADFPHPPFDFFYLNFQPLQQQKTRRRVTKLKHHRYGYVLEKKEKKPV